MSTVERQPILTEVAADVIAHVNEGHVAELLHCVRAFTPVQDATYAQITALFTDGMQLDITSPAGVSRHVVAFSVSAPAHEAVRLTVRAAIQQLGLNPDGPVRRWAVLENRELTHHFRRITMSLPDEALDWHPGYACRFDVPGQKHGRPYTLRRVSARSHNASQTAEIDVYCHDDTLGSRWAQGLQAGDEVQVQGGRKEPLPDFSAGPTLLLGDETALPTIAALLEGWAEKPLVRVLLEISDVAEQRYLDDVALPAGVQVSWLPRQGANGQAMANVLGTLDAAPAAVWGALEFSGAKRLRQRLRADYPQANVRVSGYWRIDEQD